MAVDSRDISSEEKAEGIKPVNTAVSSSGSSGEKRSSDGSGKRILGPGDLAAINDDPMTNHSEGGINYRCLLWWYVDSSSQTPTR